MQVQHSSKTRLPVQIKLLLVVGALFSALLVALATTWVMLDRIEAKKVRVVERYVPQINRIAEVEILMFRISLEARHAMLVAPTSARELDATIQRIVGFRERKLALLNELKENATSERGIQILADIHQADATFWKLALETVGLIKAENVPGAFALLQAQLVDARNRQLGHIDEMQAWQQHLMDEAIKEIGQDAQATKIGLLVFILTMLVLGGWFARSLALMLQGAFARAKAVTTQISQGDLRSEFYVAKGDEFGDLFSSFTVMQHQLRDLVEGTQSNARKLAEAAGVLNEATRIAESVAKAQHEATSGMSASVEEMSLSIDQVRDHAKEARRIAESAGESSRQGGEVVHSTAKEMQQVATAVNEAASTIRDLEQYSMEISAVVKVIREVADQTNLLALNAAIEAARAGEQGRGFAVVADEVRKLAERTSESTHTIASVIEKVQTGARRAAQEIENGVSRVEGGVKLAHEAGNSIVGIQTDSKRVVSTISDIGHALDEQSSATQAIASNIDRIAVMAEESSMSAQEAVKAANKLGDLSKDLLKSVESFRI